MKASLSGDEDMLNVSSGGASVPFLRLTLQHQLMRLFLPSRSFSLTLSLSLSLSLLLQPF
jgi:hypothetical protein